MKFDVSDLVAQGLVKKKTYAEGRYKGLSVLKYTRKVFFKNLWHLDNRLLDCRGMVVDEDWNVVVWPFTKTFNLGENGTNVDPERMVAAYRKVNGFMAAVTMTDKYGLIVSTTGTLDSEYAEIARKWVEKGDTDLFIKDRTYLFEICDNTDPHIVYENEGAYLLGIRDLNTGEIVKVEKGELIPTLLMYKSVEVKTLKFKDLPLDVKHEGWMVCDAETKEYLCKIKSKHYLTKKALQRVGRNKASKMWNTPELFKQQLDEEYYKLFDAILDNFTQEDYLELSEQQRRHWIEDWFDKQENYFE